ncbi:hypothetical protein CP488_01353 [Chthonomonas calidirosea]|nr:hypothetical protein CP488_01353 [Chthonomonas calidirosea]
MLAALDRLLPHGHWKGQRFSAYCILLSLETLAIERA